MFTSMIIAMALSGATPAAEEAASAPEATEESSGMTIRRVDGRDPSIPDDRTIKCRSVKQLGTRIPDRVCRSLSEWAQIDKENREQAETNMRTKGASGDNGNF